ncbi:XRE family transcriptional regulator [Nitrolancea hollandica]|uniref:Helix-turn-helix domain protein n=1 Tax=Nitrolancea hollandica Lb TaxID=1129897 RepID=I4ELK5_9BACT|nr:XRE family transcriptional regulator [Nitrolancea hollandica]CCF85567.1 Helix-turn-helix domain protein [Nitrolancea hollandica Lb]
MAKNFQILRDQVRSDPVRRERVAQRKRAITLALALAELRKCQEVTQQEMAERLAVSQANVSRIEHQDDLYLSTLEDYVAALGGKLEVTAVFPEQRVTLLDPQRLAAFPR